MLWGVDWPEEDAGEGVSRVREGVRVRERGRRKETLRSLSKGDSYPQKHDKH